jgi:hypothetical protein
VKKETSIFLVKKDINRKNSLRSSYIMQERKEIIKRQNMPEEAENEFP